MLINLCLISIIVLISHVLLINTMEHFKDNDQWVD